MNLCLIYRASGARSTCQWQKLSDSVSACMACSAGERAGDPCAAGPSLRLLSIGGQVEGPLAGPPQTGFHLGHVKGSGP